jgi:hypothetical protein
MKHITQLMVNEFKIKEVGCDFMGYKLQKEDSLTFHHLIIPRRNGGQITRQNGAIIQRMPHDYLHLIERICYDTFCYITSEMIDMNIKGFLDPENLAQIDLLLQQFEAEHEHDTTKKGKQLIKREYIEGRINWANRQK